GKIMQNISKKTQAEIANFSGLLGRVLTEMRLVKVSRTEKIELDNAHKNLKEIYFLGLKQAKITAVIQPISGVIMLLTIAVILGFGAIRISTGAITAGTLIAMIFYVIQLTQPLINLSTLVTDYKKAVGASSRIYEIMEEPTEVFVTGQLQPIIDGSLTFENVDLQYGSKPILSNISFDIPSTSVTAFVGPSGSGKSTIFNIIERMYDTEHVDTKYGNQSIYDIALGAWREKFGYVIQSYSLMKDTIRYNMSYGIKREVSGDELMYDPQLANCHEFIVAFEEGYDIIVGERGLKFSAGLRQRIHIARSVVTDTYT